VEILAIILQCVVCFPMLRTHCVYFQVSYEPDKWFDVPLEESQRIECSFCVPGNDQYVVQVTSFLATFTVGFI